jgi:hypothetical protein
MQSKQVNLSAPDAFLECVARNYFLNTLNEKLSSHKTKFKTIDNGVKFQSYRLIGWGKTNKVEK